MAAPTSKNHFLLKGSEQRFVNVPRVMFKCQNLIHFHMNLLEATTICTKIKADAHGKHNLPFLLDFTICMSFRHLGIYVNQYVSRGGHSLIYSLIRLLSILRHLCFSGHIVICIERQIETCYYHETIIKRQTIPI